MTLRARLDADLKLTGADPKLLAMNMRAGGAVGEPLALSPIARLARLALRLGVEIDRTVTIADDEVDVDAWIVATPDDDGGVALAATLLRERDPWRAPATGAASPEPVPSAAWRWEADAALRLVHVDAAAAQHGVEPKEALGTALTALFTLNADDHGGMPLLEAVAAANDFSAQPARVAASGAAVMLTGHVRRDRAGGFAGFVGGVTDVTPAEPAKVEATGAFNQRLELILRDPLGRIVANADSINAAVDGPLDPTYADYAADIASAARHLLGLVDDLADLEAIEREDFAIEAEPIDLADVARRAAGLLAVRAADAGVTVDRGDTDQPMMASGEFRRTLQILVNLMTNAVRYSPRGATVWIRLQRDGARACVIVADQGKGVAPEDHERIFAKFGRVDVNEPGGSGLGLYIARRLAQAMGGDLTVDSAAGSGARFILALPAV